MTGYFYKTYRIITLNGDASVLNEVRKIFSHVIVENYTNYEDFIKNINLHKARKTPADLVIVNGKCDTYCSTEVLKGVLKFSNPTLKIVDYIDKVDFKRKIGTMFAFVA